MLSFVKNVFFFFSILGCAVFSDYLCFFEDGIRGVVRSSSAIYSWIVFETFSDLIALALLVKSSLLYVPSL